MAMPTQMIGGLVSGFDTVNIIEQLMSIERRPIKMLEEKKVEHQTQLEAYRGVNNLLMQFSSSVSTLSDASMWRNKSVSSSNEAVLSAVANTYAEEGSHTFRVGRLAQAAEYLSGGFSDSDSSPVSSTGGEIRIDDARSRVDRGTSVQELNGGQGIYHGSIRITDKTGHSAVIDLSTADTLDEVLRRINGAEGVDVEAAVKSDPVTGGEGDGLVIRDLSGGGGTLEVEEVGMGSTAADLGILGSAAGAATEIAGTNINTLSGRTTLASLRDGLGVNGGSPGIINIEVDGATNFNADLSGSKTLQDVIDKINNAPTNPGVTATISADGRSLTLVGPAGSNLKVTNIDPGTTAEDLGLLETAGAGDILTGRKLRSTLNSVQVASLSGRNGTGINGARGDLTQGLGTIQVSDNGGGTWTDFDLSILTGEDSLADVVERLNERAATAFGAGALEFGINSAGNGLEVVNNSVGVDFDFRNGAGTAAADLGLDGVSVAAGKTLNAGDLDRNYISAATKLSTLNQGTGVTGNAIKITNSNGAYAEVSLMGADTIGDVVQAINDSSLNVSASINATGDGILLQDNNGGSNQIEVEEVGGGSLASDLGILGIGTDVAGTSTINGSFERVVELDGDDTLMDVMNKIGNSGAGVHASIIQDGSTYAPFRLVVSSDETGAIGDVVLDSGVESLQFRQNNQGQDAILLMGSPGQSSSPVMLKSATNTNNKAVLGLSLQLGQVSDEYVTVNVSRNTEPVSEGVSKLVETYNAMHDLVSELDSFDAETNTPGILFGDGETRALMREISDMFFETVESPDGRKLSFYDIGVKFTKEGRLEQDSFELSNLLSTDPEMVETLLTFTRDVARKDLHATAGATSPGDGSTSAENLINGNTDSKEFGAANGYQSQDTLDAGPQSVTVDFGSTRMLDELALYHVDNDIMPADQYALRDFDVEYQNAAGEWEMLRNVSGNTSPYTFIGFDKPTPVRALRINGYRSNAAGLNNKFRLIEVEANEAQGLATRMDQLMNELTDSRSGYFAEQQDLIDSKIDDIEESIESMETRAEQVEIGYLRQFSAMESALSQMQMQGDYFAEQMGAWTAEKGK